MHAPTIFIEDSVGTKLGYAHPVRELSTFLTPASLTAALEFIHFRDEAALSVVCVDAAGNHLRGSLSVQRSGDVRFVSLQIGEFDRTRHFHRPKNGALSDGTVVWTLDVQKSEIHVQHRSGPKDDFVSFTTDLESWWKSVHEADRPALTAQLQTSIATGADIHVTVRIHRSGDEIRIIEAFGRAVRRGDLTVEIVGLSIDVTSRIATMQAFANESARLEHALEASSMGIWEWNVKTGTVSWSDRVADIFGVSLDDFPGTLEGFESYVHPDDRGEVGLTIANFMNGLSAQYLVDHRIIRPSGEVRWVEGRGDLLRDEDGAPLVLMGTVWDATALRSEKQRVQEIERELGQASRRLKLASEAAGIGLWEVSLNRGILSWDAQMCRLCGLEQDGYVGPGTAWADAVHPDDFDSSLEEFFRALEEGHATCSFRVLLPDGSIRHLVSFGQVVVEPGRGPRLVGLCMDVSERAEAELRERNRNRVLEAMVSTASVQEVLSVLVNVLEEEEVQSRFGFMLVDASGRYLENGAAPSLPEFYLEAIDRFPIGAQNGSCGSAAAMGEPVIAEDVQTHPNWVNHRDLADSAGIRACWSIPVVGPKGRLFGTLALYSSTPRLRDDHLIRRMTAAADFAALAIERKKAEVEARNRELLLQSMGEIGSMGGWEADLLSGVRVWTDEMNKIHGLDSFSDSLDILDLYTPDSQSRLLAAMEHATKTGEPWTLELELVTKAGRHAWIRSEGRTQSADGRVVRLFGAAQDITAMKLAEIEYVKLQEQLLHAQKMESIGRLAGGVAHDFNNIVSVILGHAELALESAQVGSELMEDLNEIRMAAERSASLTHQLLAFARKQPMSPVTVNINDTIIGMVNMLRRLLGGQIELSWDSDPDLWSVFVDPAQIDQILANLCVNARDAIGARGTVKITTTNVVLDADSVAELSECEPGAYICLSVADNGTGIPKDILENIFEPFFTTKGVGMGTGLGLATVYGIVKQNGGCVRVESEVGHGTRFEVYLPRHGASDKPEPDGVAGPTSTRLSSMVLVVDDEPTLLKVTTRMLKGLGHQVLPALGPKEAIRIAAESGHIDLLLTDVIMPEMNGKELADILAPLHPGLTVILMSGYTAEILEEEGVQGEMFFLQKPFSLSELGRVVAEALNPV